MPARTTAILWAFFFTTCLSPPQSRLFFLQLLLVQYFVFSSYLHFNYSFTSLAGSCLLACNKTGHVLCWKKPPQLPPCELRPPKKAQNLHPVPETPCKQEPCFSAWPNKALEMIPWKPRTFSSYHCCLVVNLLRSYLRLHQFFSKLLQFYMPTDTNPTASLAQYATKLLNFVVGLYFSVSLLGNPITSSLTSILWFLSCHYDFLGALKSFMVLCFTHTQRGELLALSVFRQSCSQLKMWSVVTMVAHPVLQRGHRCLQELDEPSGRAKEVTDRYLEENILMWK